MQFHSSFINDILTYIERKSSVRSEPVRLNEISEHLGISNQDAKLICAIIQRKRLISIKVANEDNQCILTEAGKARLNAIKNARAAQSSRDEISTQLSTDEH